MKFSKIIILFFVLGFFSMSLLAQDLPNGVVQEQIQAELVKNDLTEDEVREALATNGYDYDNLDSLTPEQFPAVQAIIEELVASKKIEVVLPVVQDTIKVIEESEVIESAPEVIMEDVKVENEIYGHRMFRNKEIKFFSNKDGIRAPDHYILGVGDELAVSIFGRSYYENTFVVNPSGYIQILNGKKKILLKNLTLGQARAKLIRIFAAYYKFAKEEFNLSLNYSRPITVTIYGEVRKPGAITLPALNNVFNALAAVDGPSHIGSVRRIQVIKKNGQRSVIDLFEYINNSSSNKSFHLSDNDMIIVPAIETVVQLKGEVNRPMSYEMLNGEGIGTLIKFAAGFTKQAYTKSLKVIRTVNNSITFIDIDYKNQKHFGLKNGDEIVVNPISSELVNYISIQGEVVSPGKYERNKGMRISDLVKKAGLKKETRSDLIYLKRVANDNSVTYTALNLDEILANPRSSINQLLQDKDELTLWAKEIFLESGSVDVTGAVRDPKELIVNGGETMTVKDAIQLSGGLQDAASNRVMVYRKGTDSSTKIEYVNLLLDKGLDSEDAQFLLNANDEVHVFANAVFEKEYTISVAGAVNGPGSFQYGTGMTLKDALLLSRGLIQSAAKNRIEISRIILNDNEPTQIVIANLEIDNDYNVKDGEQEFLLEPYDKIFVRYVPDFELQRTVNLIGEIKYPGSYAIISENETILDIINRAGGVTEEAFVEGAKLNRPYNDMGNIIIDMEDIMDNKKSRYNFKVRNGDKISIPKINDFVSISGAINVRDILSNEMIEGNNLIHVPFVKGKNAMYYINEFAGGLGDKADRKKIAVRYANGSKKRTINYLVFKKYPEVKTGAEIVVGYKPKEVEEKRKNREPVDWNKVVTATVAQATGILSLLLLTQRLNN